MDLLSARLENRDQLDAEIRKADVICIVYAVNQHATFGRISSYWLPYIRSLGRNVPVVLVGNKIDARGDDVTNEGLEDEIMPIMEEFKVGRSSLAFCWKGCVESMGLTGISIVGTNRKSKLASNALQNSHSTSRRSFISPKRRSSILLRLFTTRENMWVVW